MKTREEIVAAILDGGGISTIFITGNRLTSLGLTRLMHDCYLQDIELPNR